MKKRAVAAILAAVIVTAMTGCGKSGSQTESATAATTEEASAEIAAEDELLAIPDIGEVVAESILAWFNDEENIKLLAEMKELGVVPLAEEMEDLPLAGRSYVVSGTLASMGREEAEDKLRALGATVTSSVTKGTTALILGEKPGKSKLDKADKLGIPRMSEVEFLKLIEIR